LSAIDIKEGNTLESKQIMNAYAIAKDILLKPFLVKSAELEQLKTMGRRKKTEFLEGTKLVESKEEKALLNVWINMPNVQTDLLYRATADGFTAAKFHELCDDQGATLVLIKSEVGFVFGGYTSISWVPNGQYYPDDKNFLFSLTYMMKLD
jgi:hypothetical protein